MVKAAQPRGTPKGRRPKKAEKRAKANKRATKRTAARAEPQDPHAHTIALLEAAGLTVSVSNALAEFIDPNVDYEEVRRELATRRFNPPLSEVIIAERG